MKCLQQSGSDRVLLIDTAKQKDQVDQMERIEEESDKTNHEDSFFGDRLKATDEGTNWHDLRQN